MQHPTEEEILTWPPEKAEEYLSLAEELEEIEKTEKSRSTFTGFFSATTPFNPEPMQAHMGELIERITLQHETGVRELIHKPPQHGGSIAITQEFIPFYLGHNPTARVRLLTYNITHSEHFSDTIIRIMQSPEYKKIFPNPDCWIPDRVRAGEWSTNARARINDSQHSFMALGLQTGFVGSGGDLILVDDAYANDKDPFSEIINLGLRKTFNEVILTRANPETNIVVMAHSWNQKDLRAWLLEQGGWNDTRYAAICDSGDDPLKRQIGESLSDRYPIEYLLKLKDGGKDEKGKPIQGMGSSAFNSLYQGNGMSRDGSKYKLEWFDFVEDFRRMEDSLFFLYCDPASSAEPTADRTAISLLYKRPDGTYTWIKSWWGRFTPSGTTNFVKNICKEVTERYGMIAPIIPYIEEPPGAGNVYTDSIISACAQYGMRSDRVSKDKITRALPLIACMEVGNINILKTALEQEMIDEILGFPNSKHDDLNDSITGAMNMAATVSML